MGFLKKLKFWKKRNINTGTKVDASISTEDPRTCDVSTVSMDLAVMCAACTQTESSIAGGSGAAKVDYESELDMKNKEILELEEELAVSKCFTADLMLNVKSVEQQLRKYAEEPVILWSEDCECKHQLSAVADLLTKCIIVETDDKSKSETTCVKDKEILELEEELAVSKCFTADLMLNVKSVEQQLRKYTEEPVILWSEYCECKHQLSAVADLLTKCIIVETDDKSKSETTCVKDKEILELEEELAVSKCFTADLMLNVKSVEQQLRKYAEEPVILWSEDCECKHQLSAVADLLTKCIIVETEDKLKSETTCVKNTNIHCETQTEENSRQSDSASAVWEETARRLVDKNRKLAASVEQYQKEIGQMKEDMAQMRRDTAAHIQHMRMKLEGDNERQIMKMRDLRDELLWYKKQLPVAHNSDDRESAVRPNGHADRHLAGPSRDNRDRHPRHSSRKKPYHHPFGSRA